MDYSYGGTETNREQASGAIKIPASHSKCTLKTTYGVVCASSTVIPSVAVICAPLPQTSPHARLFTQHVQRAEWLPATDRVYRLVSLSLI